MAKTIVGMGVLVLVTVILGCLSLLGLFIGGWLVLLGFKVGGLFISAGLLSFIMAVLILFFTSD